MQPDTPTVHRNLGELAAMQRRVEQTERNILARGEELLSQAEKTMADTRAAALAGDAEASRRYQEAVADRGRCQMVVAQARRMLAE